MSPLVLITLAELAWLAAFALLFAYRSQVGELGNLRRQLEVATNEVAQWEIRSPEAAALIKELAALKIENQRLQQSLRTMEKHLPGIALDEAVAKLREADEAKGQTQELQRKLREDQKALSAAEAEATALRSQVAVLTSNNLELEKLLKSTQGNEAEIQKSLQNEKSKLATINTSLAAAQADRNQVVVELRAKEAGEFSVRRELTGLPDKEIKRVVFIVDTSQSMKGSKAWPAARNLIRTWLEFLPVEECALVNFNNQATGYPEKRYLQVRGGDGRPMQENHRALLEAFDHAPGGIDTDLFKGLKYAYAYPKADLIVLFSDGMPRVNYASESSLLKKIFEQVNQHPDIPILSVAVGSYEVTGAGGPRPQTNAPIAFLRELARKSGGNFIAR